jgi:glycosidase
MDVLRQRHLNCREYVCRIRASRTTALRIGFMNTKQTRLFAPLAFLFALLASFPAQGAIERVEPPSWWTGFKNTELQLLVYGAGISDFEPTVAHEGIRLLRVERVQSPNYLFIYLDIAPETSAGSFEISFSNGKERLAHEYRLHEKNPDPDHARGFGRSDAIYLITPDRFANGDASNDNIKGLAEQADRGNKDGRHGGDIRGILNSLDYIADMGFTAIWLNPLLENDMPAYSYHGYSTTDFYRVDARFGSNEEYRELVQTGRAKGIGTIMDMIINHSGSEHWWMDDLPSEDWINHVDEPRFTNHLRMTNQDPNASAYDSDRMSDGWFVDTMPDLNQRNPLMGDYLVQNAIWWIEYLGLAGIRMDTWPYPDKDYMAEWTRRVMLEYPQFNIVGEEWSSNPAVVAYWQRGQSNLDGYHCELPSLMDFPLQEALWLALTTPDGELMFDNSPGGLPRLYRALANDFQYPDPDNLVIFPDNHDMPRIYSLLGEDDALYRMAMAFYATMRGIPQIYYGTEVLMSNTGDPSHGNIRSDFPGGWSGDPIDAFSGDGLSEQAQAAQSYVRQMLQWRKGKAAIHDGETTHFYPENAVYVYFRHNDNDAVMVVINKNEEPVSLPLDRYRERTEGFEQAREVISGQVQALGSELQIPARDVQVFELQ